MFEKIKKRIDALEKAADGRELYIVEYEDGRRDKVPQYDLLLYPLRCRQEQQNGAKKGIIPITRIYCKTVDDPFVALVCCLQDGVYNYPRPEIVTREA